MPKDNSPAISTTSNRRKVHERKPVERKPDGCKKVNARINFFENRCPSKPPQAQPSQSIFVHAVYQSDLSVSQHKLLNFIGNELKESKDRVEQIKKGLKQLESKIKLSQGSQPMEAESARFSSGNQFQAQYSQGNSYHNVLQEKLAPNQNLLESPFMVQQVNQLFKLSSLMFFNQNKEEVNDKKMEPQVQLRS